MRFLEKRGRHREKATVGMNLCRAHHHSSSQRDVGVTRRVTRSVLHFSRNRHVELFLQSRVFFIHESERVRTALERTSKTKKDIHSIAVEIGTQPTGPPNHKKTREQDQSWRDSLPRANYLFVLLRIDSSSCLLSSQPSTILPDCIPTTASSLHLTDSLE
jgi:hypothetical protein